MLIKEAHKDVARYLAEDCYCPNEIYDDSGIWFQTFEADEKCELLGIHEAEPKCEKFIAVIARNQILIFWINKNKVINAVRYDATENNKKNILNVINNGFSNKFKADTFTRDELEAFKKLSSIADAVAVD